MSYEWNVVIKSGMNRFINGVLIWYKLNVLAKRELKHTNVTSVLLTGLIVKCRFISNGDVAICDSFKEFLTDEQHCFFQMNMSPKNESKEWKVKVSRS